MKLFFKKKEKETKKFPKIWSREEIEARHGFWVTNILFKKKEDCTDHEKEIQKIYKNVRIF